MDKALTLWRPRALSHEVDHSVRILAGPGFGPTLLPQIISEGISSVFDEAAFPGLTSASAMTIMAGSHYQPCP